MIYCFFLYDEKEDVTSSHFQTSYGSRPHMVMQTSGPEKGDVIFPDKG